MGIKGSCGRLRWAVGTVLPWIKAGGPVCRGTGRERCYVSQVLNYLVLNTFRCRSGFPAILSSSPLLSPVPYALPPASHSSGNRKDDDSGDDKESYVSQFVLYDFWPFNRCTATLEFECNEGLDSACRHRKLFPSFPHQLFISAFGIGFTCPPGALHHKGGSVHSEKKVYIFFRLPEMLHI